MFFHRAQQHTHYSCYVLIILTFSESPKHNLTENRNWRFWSLKINNISWHRHNNYSLARGHRSGIRDKNYKLDQSDLIFAYLVVPWPGFRDINLRTDNKYININVQLINNKLIAVTGSENKIKIRLVRLNFPPHPRNQTELLHQLTWLAVAWLISLVWVVRCGNRSKYD